MRRASATTVGSRYGVSRSDDGRVKRSLLVSSAATTAVVAWAGLFLLCRFLWTKIESSTQETEWFLLPAFALCVAVVVASRLGRGERVVFRGSFEYTGIFMLYFLIRLAIDAETASDFTGYTRGLTHGILFAYGLGIVLRTLLEAASAPAAGRWVWFGAAVFLSFNSWSALRAEFVSDAPLGAPSFLAETYQVSGLLASVIAVIAAVVVTRSLPVSRRGGWNWRAVVLLGLALALFALIARLTQLMGSNAGPAFTLPLAVILCAVVLTPFGERVLRRSGKPRGKRSIRSAMLWGRARAVVGLCVGVSALIGVAFWIAVTTGAIDVTGYRMFDFEESRLVNTSVESRFEILAANFETQFAYAPIFGNFFVDRYTTGGGSYAHSLLSILPHLGIVGMALFCAMSVAVSKQLWIAWTAAMGRPGEQRFVMLSIVVMAWATAYLMLTASFTSAILWLPLGLFAPAVQLARRPQRLDGGQPRPLHSAP